MKNNFNLFYLIFAAAILFAFTTPSSAQRVLGGYQAAKVTDAGVKDAAKFAVSTEAEKSQKEMKLLSIVKAERQSVAGSNYRLCLKVDSEGGEGQDAVTIFVQAVVYVSLKQESELKSWEISESADDDK